MKASDLKAGMFCVVDRNRSGNKSLCLVMSGIYPEDDDLSVISFVGSDSWCMAPNLSDEHLLVVFTADGNSGCSRILKLETIPTIEELKHLECEILYSKDDLSSEIQTRINTLKSEIDQLTQELNSL